MSPDTRIVHVMGWRSQQYGSFERFLVALAESCAANGAETHLVFPSPPASSAFLADAAADVHVVPAARAPGDPLFALALARLLRRTRATHLHVHFGADSYTAVAVARPLGVRRRFATKHIVPGARGGRHRWLARQVEVTFAVSELVAGRLRQTGVPPRAIEVAYLGVDCGRYRPDAERRRAARTALGLGDAQRLVLSTSHLRPGKGVEALPGLAAGLAATGGDVVMAVAGDGPLREQLAAAARERGLGAERFRLLGVREDVPELLAAADLFVFPTDGDEAMGLGVLEALAGRVPVVTTDVADFARLRDGAAIVPAGDVDALLAAARELLADPAGAAALAERGRRLVEERYSVERGVAAHVRRYFAPPAR